MDRPEGLFYPGMVGRTLILAGVLLILIGLLVTYGPRLPLRIGRLPGDIYIARKNTSFYFPLTTCVLLSMVLAVVMWLFRR